MTQARSVAVPPAGDVSVKYLPEFSQKAAEKSNAKSSRVDICALSIEEKTILPAFWENVLHQVTWHSAQQE